MTRIGPCPICPLAGTVGSRGRLRVEARRPRRLGAGARALGEALGHAEEAVRRAGRALVLPGSARAERLDLIVVAELAARLREERHVRRPAAGDREQIAFDLDRRPPTPSPASGRTATPADPMPALGADDRGVAVDGDAAPRRLGEMLLRHLGAEIDDRRDLAAGARHVERRVPAGIVVGEDDDAFARQHAVAVHVGAHRAGEHDAGPVVLVEDQRPLDRAGGEHDLLRAHAPEPLARQARRPIRGRRDGR